MSLAMVKGRTESSFHSGHCMDNLVPRSAALSCMHLFPTFTLFCTCRLTALPFPEVIWCFFFFKVPFGTLAFNCDSAQDKKHFSLWSACPPSVWKYEGRVGGEKKALTLLKCALLCSFWAFPTLTPAMPPKCDSNAYRNFSPLFFFFFVFPWVQLLDFPFATFLLSLNSSKIFQPLMISSSITGL